MSNRGEEWVLDKIRANIKSNLKWLERNRSKITDRKKKELVQAIETARRRLNLQRHIEACDPRPYVRRQTPEDKAGLAAFYQRHRVGRLLAREEGASMVEYGLMVALIAVACIAVVTSLGVDLSGLFSAVDASVKGAGS